MLDKGLLSGRYGLLGLHGEWGKIEPGLMRMHVRFSVGKPRPQTPLDAIKFICKDLWTLLFRKQIDNLKTNHRGVFVLTDSRFQPLSRMSVDRRAGSKASEDALRRAQTVRLDSFDDVELLRLTLQAVSVFPMRRD